MSNNLEYTDLKTSLESILIDNLQLTLKEIGVVFNFFLQEETLNIIIELPINFNLDKDIIEKEIYNIATGYNIKESRVIFMGKKTSDKPQKQKHSIFNVKRILLTSSAKGGVGKSTVAVNIAKAMAKMGQKVGIVDADIYGPTIPKLLGINQQPATENGKMLPILKDGIYSISIGYIIDASQAAIWRGPMISKALYQLLVGVNWPELDCIIIDMPPGTGDIYLSLVENFIIDGVVLVTTPQNISYDILKKSINFFNKMNVSILGIVENMSYFLDDTGNKHYIFGKSKKNNSLDILGEIPLITKIAEYSDAGEDLSNNDEFIYYKKIATKIM